MNTNVTFKNPHFYIELLLISIIIFLVIGRANVDIKVDPKGFVKNPALNFTLTGDGVVVVSDPNGNEIVRSPINEIGKLHSLSFYTIGDMKNYNNTQGLLDTMISRAVADIPKGKYVRIPFNIDGQSGCRWFNDNTLC